MPILIRGFIFRIIFTAISFLVSLLVAKLAGAGQFGTLSLMIVNASIIHILTGLGTDAAIVWHGIADKEFSRNKVFSITVRSAILQLTLFYGVALLYYLFFGKSILGSDGSGTIFLAELFYFTGLVLTDKFSSLYYSQHESNRGNKLLAISGLILFFTLMMIWLTNPAVITEYSIWVYSLFIFIPSMSLLYGFVMKFNPSFEKIRGSDIRSFTSFSFLVLITNLIQFVAFRADYWIINFFYDTAEVGVYAQSSKFTQLLWIIPGILAGLITPALKNEKNKLTDQELLTITRLTLFSHILLSFLLVIISWVIYMFFLPHEYFRGFFALLIMMPGYIIFTLTTILAAYYSANRLLKINFFGSLLCFVSIVILDFLLIPVYGINGAAAANLTAYTVTTIYFIIVSRKFIRSAFSDFIIIRPADFSFSKPEFFNRVKDKES